MDRLLRFQMVMGEEVSVRDVLLAVALGSRGSWEERRLLPDRRSGTDRRKLAVTVAVERRTGAERRRAIRRERDREDDPTLLENARRRLGPSTMKPSA